MSAIYEGVSYYLRLESDRELYQVAFMVEPDQRDRWMISVNNVLDGVIVLGARYSSELPGLERAKEILLMCERDGRLVNE